MATNKRIKVPKVSPDAKQLTAEDLLVLDSQLDKPLTIPIMGNKHKVTINTYFRESRLNKIAVKYVSFLQDLNQRDNIDDITIVNTINLIHSLILHEFSDVPLPSIDSIDDLILIQNRLLDLGILDEIFPHYPQSEVKKVTDKIDQLAKNAGQLLGELAVKQSLKDVEVDANVQ